MVDISSRILCGLTYMLFLFTSAACSCPLEEEVTQPAPEESNVAPSPGTIQIHAGVPISGCYWVRLSKRIPWVTSGVWLGDEQTLLVVNTGTRSLEQQGQRQGSIPFASSPLLKISSEGKVRELGRGLDFPSAAVTFELERPSQIRRHKDGYLLQENHETANLQQAREPTDILRLGAKLELKNITRTGGKSLTEALELATVYDWSPVGSGFLAFGDLKDIKNDEQESGFFYFDGAPTGWVLHRISNQANVRNHYTKNAPYIASIGETGYILFLEQSPKIVEVDLKSHELRELEFFPEEFRNRPLLKRDPSVAGREQARIFYEIMERSTMAAGLLALKDHLYLLVKGAMTSSFETDWWLIKIHPGDGGREVSRVQVPTSAAHLTVVPGEHWAFLEKGEVEGTPETNAPYMNTETMVIVPSAWIEEPENHPLSSGEGLDCPELKL